MSSGIPGYVEIEQGELTIIRFTYEDKTYQLTAVAGALQKCRRSIALTYLLLVAGDGDAALGNERLREYREFTAMMLHAKNAAFLSTGEVLSTV